MTTLTEAIIRPEWTIPNDPYIGEGYTISSWEVKTLDYDPATWMLIGQLKSPNSPEIVTIVIFHEWIEPLANHLHTNPECKQAFDQFIQSALIDPLVLAMLDHASSRPHYRNFSNSFKAPDTLDSYKVLIKRS